MMLQCFPLHSSLALAMLLFMSVVVPNSALAQFGGGPSEELPKESPGPALLPLLDPQVPKDPMPRAFPGLRLSCAYPLIGSGRMEELLSGLNMDSLNLSRTRVPFGQDFKDSCEDLYYLISLAGDRPLLAPETLKKPLRLVFAAAPGHFLEAYAGETLLARSVSPLIIPCSAIPAGTAHLILHCASPHGQANSGLLHFDLISSTEQVAALTEPACATFAPAVTGAHPPGPALIRRHYARPTGLALCQRAAVTGRVWINGRELAPGLTEVPQDFWQDANEVIFESSSYQPGPRDDLSFWIPVISQVRSPCPDAVGQFTPGPFLELTQAGWELLLRIEHAKGGTSSVGALAGSPGSRCLDLSAWPLAAGDTMIIEARGCRALGQGELPWRWLASSNAPRMPLGQDACRPCLPASAIPLDALHGLLLSLGQSRTLELQWSLSAQDLLKTWVLDCAAPGASSATLVGRGLERPLAVCVNGKPGAWLDEGLRVTLDPASLKTGLNTLRLHWPAYTQSTAIPVLRPLRDGEELAGLSASPAFIRSRIVGDALLLDGSLPAAGQIQLFLGAQQTSALDFPAGLFHRRLELKGVSGELIARYDRETAPGQWQRLPLWRQDFTPTPCTSPVVVDELGWIRQDLAAIWPQAELSAGLYGFLPDGSSLWPRAQSRIAATLAAAKSAGQDQIRWPAAPALDRSFGEAECCAFLRWRSAAKVKVNLDYISLDEALASNGGQAALQDFRRAHLASIRSAMLNLLHDLHLQEATP